MDRFCPDCKEKMIKLDEVHKTNQVTFIYACNDGADCSRPLVYIIYKKDGERNVMIEDARRVYHKKSLELRVLDMTRKQIKGGVLHQGLKDMLKEIPREELRILMLVVGEGEFDNKIGDYYGKRG